jgi:hypothetical protein
METPAEVRTMFKMVWVVFFSSLSILVFDGVLDEKKDDAAADGQGKDEHGRIADQQLVPDAQIRKSTRQSKSSVRHPKTGQAGRVQSKISRRSCSA